MFDEIWLNFLMRSGVLALLEQSSRVHLLFSTSPGLACCGLMVSSPGLCASSGGRMPEALFMVFLLD